MGMVQLDNRQMQSPVGLRRSAAVLRGSKPPHLANACSNRENDAFCGGPMRRSAALILVSVQAIEIAKHATVCGGWCGGPPIPLCAFGALWGARRALVALAREGSGTFPFAGRRGKSAKTRSTPRRSSQRIPTPLRRHCANRRTASAGNSTEP
jgi:hypothetical protein